MTTFLRHSLALDASVRSYDVDGRLKVARSHISKACVSPYMGSEIPGWEALGLNPHGIYSLLRAPTELKKAETSFNELPILLKHDATSAADPKKDLVVGTTGSNAAFDGQFLDNSLSIWDGEAIKLIESGAQKELSCGYRYAVEMRAGRYNGEDYHGVMRSIVGNHVALVERGRAGPEVVVGDAALRQTSPRKTLIQPPSRKDQRMAARDMSQETNIRAAMAFLKDKLSDEDIAELARIIGQGGGADGSEQPVTMAALAELDQARKETAPVLGAANDMALDTAGEVYSAALARMGVDTQGIRQAGALRQVYLLAIQRRRETGQSLFAMDAKRVVVLHERFPHAARIGGL